jgi:quinol-cytochrome oxidoreductase complex cytochrome b subunit
VIFNSFYHYLRISFFGFVVVFFSFLLSFIFLKFLIKKNQRFQKKRKFFFGVRVCDMNCLKRLSLLDYWPQIRTSFKSVLPQQTVMRK